MNELRRLRAGQKGNPIQRIYLAVLHPELTQGADQSTVRILRYGASVHKYNAGVGRTFLSPRGIIAGIVLTSKVTRVRFSVRAA